MTNTWIPFTLDDAIAAWASEQAPVWQQGVQDTAPVGHGPTAGEFRDSIEAVVTDGGREIDVEGDQPPGRYLLTGTEEHGPVTAKALRFEIDGQVFYRKRVAGIQPSDFVERAIDAHEEESAAALLDSIARAWAGG